LNAALVLNALPFVWIAAYLHMQGTISFVGFYFMEGLKGMIVPLSLVMSTTADVAEPKLRATLFSLIMVELSIAMILAAGVGGMMTPAVAANTSVGLFATSIILYAGFMPGNFFVFVPSCESYPHSLRDPFKCLLPRTKLHSIMCSSQLFPEPQELHCIQHHE
jgi:hypothetical protein